MLPYYLYMSVSSPLSYNFIINAVDKWLFLMALSVFDNETQAQTWEATRPDVARAKVLIQA